MSEPEIASSPTDEAVQAEQKDRQFTAKRSLIRKYFFYNLGVMILLAMAGLLVNLLSHAMAWSVILLAGLIPLFGFLFVDSLIVSIRGIWRYGFRFPKASDSVADVSSSTPSVDRKFDWEQWLGIPIALIVAAAILVSRPRENQFPPIPGVRRPANHYVPRQLAEPKTSSTQYKRAEKLWQATIAARHLDRFALMPHDPMHQQTLAQLHSEMRGSVDRAKIASQNFADVDADLVDLSRRLLEIDERELQLVHQFQNFASEMNLPQEVLSVEAQLASWEVFEDLTDEQREQLPAEFRNMRNEAVEFMNGKQDQFREIELMQATLRERYQTKGFILPEVNLEITDK
ncbi:hypothetical protein [Blastopirellula marina]|uniref:Uncharacterized protein n=1 Tax=Blastopirellula marina DSM 3645 TaxID=314230 RepID=A3ZSL4_9BACT|nr:hypothetical protein [Blastopirellula marina]EAQ80674.1 hypothetical protein DSM3645_15050 [Blastopirellula marina DSM 3645]